MTDTDLVIDTLENVLGSGVFYTLSAVFFIHTLHFLYISGSGIRKLDAYFENGKDYGDTWSIGANFRYFGYCWKFTIGRLKVEDHDMRWWMYFNASGYVVSVFFMLSVFITDCYLSFFG